jgi:hypothetical protein
MKGPKLTEPAPSTLTDRLAQMREEMRASMAGGRGRMGRSLALAKVLLRFLEVLLRLVTDFEAGWLVAPEPPAPRAPGSVSGSRPGTGSGLRFPAEAGEGARVAGSARSGGSEAPGGAACFTAEDAENRGVDACTPPVRRSGARRAPPAEAAPHARRPQPRCPRGGAVRTVRPRAKSPPPSRSPGSSPGGGSGTTITGSIQKFRLGTGGRSAGVLFRFQYNMIWPGK